MNFRFSLGRKEIGTNRITNGDFSAGLASWVQPGAAWSVIGGEADIAGPGFTEDTLTQASVFELGKRYKIRYDIRFVGGDGKDANLGLRVGEYGKEMDNTTSSSFVTIEKERPALKGTDIVFVPSPGLTSAIRLDNVEVFELAFNDPLSDEPIGFDTTKIKYQRDRDLNALYTRFLVDTLTFQGDGFAFIDAARLSDGSCAIIPIKIEFRCSETDQFADLFTGAIYMEDCKFDPLRKEVECKVEDEIATRSIIKNKGTKIFITTTALILPVANPGDFLLPDPRNQADFHDSSGSLAFLNLNTFNIETLLRRIILSITDLEVDLDTNIFNGFTFDELAITYGKILRQVADFPSDDVLQLSLDQVFGNLDKIFSLSMRMKKDVNGVNKIQIDQKIDFRLASSVLTLNNVPNPTFSFDKKALVRTVDIGYLKKGFEDAPHGVQFVLDEGCEDNLDLRSEWIQDSSSFFTLLGSPLFEKRDGDIFIVELENVGYNLRTKDFDPSFSHAYNGNIDPEDNMDRWVQILSDSAKLIQDTTISALKLNSPLIRVWEFEHELAFSDLTTILDSIEQITFNSTDIPDIKGFILDIEFDIKTTLTRFKLLTE